MIAIDGFPPMNGDGWMLCPVCGFEAVHVAYQETVTGDYPDSGHPGFCPRGGFIRLSANCEAGCEFEILIGQHKGSTPVATYGRSHDEVVCDGVRFDSKVERDFWLAMHRHGRHFVPDALKGLVAQHDVHIDGHRYRLDFADPQRRLCIEIDGLAYHNGQDSFMRDRRRERALQMDGWRVLRFAAKEITADAAGCVRQAAAWAASA